MLQMQASLSQMIQLGGGGSGGGSGGEPPLMLQTQTSLSRMGQQQPGGGSEQPSMAHSQPSVELMRPFASSQSAGHSAGGEVPR